MVGVGEAPSDVGSNHSILGPSSSLSQFRNFYTIGLYKPRDLIIHLLEVQRNRKISDSLSIFLCNSDGTMTSNFLCFVKTLCLRTKFPVRDTGSDTVVYNETKSSKLLFRTGFFVFRDVSISSRFSFISLSLSLSL